MKWLYRIFIENLVNYWHTLKEKKFSRYKRSMQLTEEQMLLFGINLEY